MTERALTPEDLASMVPDGASILFNKGEGADTPFAIVRALIAQSRRDLHVITLPACAGPASGMMVDMMIAAGCVSSIETSGVSLGELGAAPAFGRAVKAAEIVVRDATCPALYAAVQAGGKSQPFVTLRGLIGTDLAANNPDWVLIDNPFQPGDKVMAIKAINPDFALIHAPMADREGNVWIGRQRDKLYAAHAARSTLVTVDSVFDGNFFDDERTAAGVIPSFYVSALSVQKGAAYPSLSDDSIDLEVVRAYRDAAQTREGARAWLAAEGLSVFESAAQ